MTAKEYFEKVCKDAGLDDAATAALIAASSNPKFAGGVEELLKKSGDYDAQVGRVNALAADKAKWEEWAHGNPAAGKPGAVAMYQELLTRYNDATTKLTAMQSALGGNPQNGGNPAPEGNPQYATVADITKMIGDLDNRWSGALKQSNLITARHVRNFNEDPDFDAIARIAKDKGYEGQADGLQRAYDEWVGPRVRTREEEAKKKWETDTRAQIERDLRSRLHVPVETAPVDYSPVFMDKGNQPLGDNALDAALVEEFANAGAKK